MGTGEFNAGGNPVMDWHPIQGGVEIFLATSCYGNWDKLWPHGPLGKVCRLYLYLVGELDNHERPVCIHENDSL